MVIPNIEFLVFVDVETTGLNPFADRIIEIFMLKLLASGEVEEYGTLINQGGLSLRRSYSSLASQMRIWQTAPKRPVQPLPSGSSLVREHWLPTTSPSTSGF